MSNVVAPVTQLIQTLLSHGCELSLAGANGALARQSVPLRIKTEGSKLKLVSIDPSIDLKTIQVEKQFGRIKISNAIVGSAVCLSSSFLGYVVWLASITGIL